jgi:hypothetical protein
MLITSWVGGEVRAGGGVVVAAAVAGRLVERVVAARVGAPPAVFLIVVRRATPAHPAIAMMAAMIKMEKNNLRVVIRSMYCQVVKKLCRKCRIVCSSFCLHALQ